MEEMMKKLMMIHQKDYEDEDEMKLMMIDNTNKRMKMS
jgi:hypothetical protein